MQKQKGKGKEEPSSALRQLTFEDICPIWASKLRTGLDAQDLKTLVRDSKYCIVGEAWGWTGRQTGYYIAPLIPFVGCWKCVKFGRSMAKIARKHSQHSVVTQLQPVIGHFVEHWNEKHLDYQRTRDSCERSES
jgi:hypothetical protein